MVKGVDEGRGPWVEVQARMWVQSVDHWGRGTCVDRGWRVETSLGWSGWTGAGRREAADGEGAEMEMGSWEERSGSEQRGKEVQVEVTVTGECEGTSMYQLRAVTWQGQRSPRRAEPLPRVACLTFSAPTYPGSTDGCLEWTGCQAGQREHKMRKTVPRGPQSCGRKGQDTRANLLAAGKAMQVHPVAQRRKPFREV